MSRYRVPKNLAHLAVMVGLFFFPLHSSATVVIHAGAVVDPVSATISEDVWIAVEDGTITAVSHDGAIAEDATVIDLCELTALRAVRFVMIDGEVFRDDPPADAEQPEPEAAKN